MRTILCSAGKGELPAQACLKCAIESPSRHPLCGLDYGYLKALLNTSEERPDIHVTDITGCLKRAYLGKKNPKPVYVHELQALTQGVAVHSFLEDNDLFMDCEYPLKGDDLRGTADVVHKLFDPLRRRIVDYKSTRWMYVDKLPYGSHALQVNIYAHLLRQEGHLVDSLAIQYIDMSGPTKCRNCKRPVRMNVFEELACPKCGNAPNNAHLGAMLVEVPLIDEGEISSLIERRKTALRQALDSAQVPGGEPSFLCGYCPFEDECEEADRNGR